VHPRATGGLDQEVDLAAQVEGRCVDHGRDTIADRAHEHGLRQIQQSFTTAVQRGPATPDPRCTHSLLAMLTNLNIAKETP